MVGRSRLISINQRITQPHTARGGPSSGTGHGTARPGAGAERDAAPGGARGPPGAGSGDRPEPDCDRADVWPLGSAASHRVDLA